MEQWAAVHGTSAVLCSCNVGSLDNCTHVARPDWRDSRCARSSMDTICGSVIFSCPKSMGSFSLTLRKKCCEHYPVRARLHMHLSGENATTIYVCTILGGLCIAWVTLAMCSSTLKQLGSLQCRQHCSSPGYDRKVFSCVLHSEG